MPSKRVPGFIVLCLVADSGLVLLYLVDWKIGGLYWKLNALVDPKGYADLVNWYSSMKLFLIACLFALFARCKIATRMSVSWILPLFPLVFAALSFNEIAQISTWLGYKSARFLPGSLLQGGSAAQREIILALIVTLGVLALALAYCLARYTRDRWDIRLKYVVGLLALVGSAAVGSALRVVPMNTPRGVLRVASEELGTLLGATLILWATYDLLVAHRLTLHAGRRDQPQR